VTGYRADLAKVSRIVGQRLPDVLVMTRQPGYKFLSAYEVVLPTAIRTCKDSSMVFIENTVQFYVVCCRKTRLIYKMWPLSNLPSNNFYRAMHYSAKHGLACRLSVHPYVCDVGGLWSQRMEYFENNFTVR